VVTCSFNARDVGGLVVGELGAKTEKAGAMGGGGGAVREGISPKGEKAVEGDGKTVFNTRMRRYKNNKTRGKSSEKKKRTLPGN